MPKRHSPGKSASRLVSHVEEIVLATSGEDAFELVYAVAAARLLGNGDAHGDADGLRARRVERSPGDLRVAIARAAAQEPALGVVLPTTADDALLAKVDQLLVSGLGLAGEWRGGETIDAVFESLVPRMAKGDKGQFFTPRHVVDFVVQALAPAAGETVVDPACGSGAFLAHASASSGARTFGCDVDGRAVRVARLLALARGDGVASIARGDGLRADMPVADVVATNPPFAGRANAEGFALGDLVRSPERDVLFLERALTLLRPGGRLGIVLPYNKASGAAFAGMRRWLVVHARVLAIVGLPRETFMPHTSQRTFVLFAKKRPTPAAPTPRDERTLFLVSEHSGKTAAGEPDPLAPPHDLAATAAALRHFLAEEAFA